jgi:predicted glycoside hydrolase/deacetylase ChbG (UPF0249 family)
MTTSDAAAAELRRIWLCADDYGLAKGVNAAIRDLLSRRRLNATSAMVLPPSFDASEIAALAELAKSADRLAIRLHLTLTAPFRPLSEGFSGLPDGRFLPLADTLRAAMQRRFSRGQLVREVTAQVEAFTSAFGRPPDFIDGHQHVQLFPQVRDALMDTAQRLAPQAWLRQCGRALPLRHRWQDRKGLLLDIFSVGFRARARARGLRTNPAFAGTYAYRDDVDFAALFPSFLTGLPKDSVVMCHPGFVDDELRRLDPLTALREQEYGYFSGPRFPQILAAHGLTLA